MRICSIRRWNGSFGSMSAAAPTAKRSCWPTRRTPMTVVARRFKGFDETHRLYLPSERAAVTTMEANLGKRVAQDPWSMSTTTAGEPGQNSVAETDHFEAEAMARGEIKRPRMFYFHRQASDDWDMDKFEDRVEAIREASGPELAARTDWKTWRRSGTSRARTSLTSSGSGQIGGHSRACRRSTLASGKRWRVRSFRFLAART